MNTDTPNELTNASFATLIGMAKSTAKLRTATSKIRAKQSGSFISRIKGRGMEFDEARLYQPGDDIRAIDWRVSARTGKTYSKLFREERERPVFISVDHSKSMAFATRGVFKSVQASKIAAILAWKAQQQGDRLGGQLFNSNGCQELKPQSGKHGVLRLFNLLTQPTKTRGKSCSLDNAIARLTQHARPGSLIYIISDFRGFGKISQTHLDRLTRHCQVVLVQIYDPLESQLPNKGQYRLTDGNNDFTINAASKRQAANYQQNYQKRVDQLLAAARKASVSLVQCATNQNPAEVLG